MPLEWSEAKPPNGVDRFYDYVEAYTPLGTICLEWKSWKKYDEPCCQMPWGECVGGRTINEAEESVQDAWDKMAMHVVKLTRKGE